MRWGCGGEGDALLRRRGAARPAGGRRGRRRAASDGRRWSRTTGAGSARLPGRLGRLLPAAIGRRGQLGGHRRGLEALEAAERAFGALEQRLAAFRLRAAGSCFARSSGHHSALDELDRRAAPRTARRARPRPPRTACVLRLRSACAASVSVCEIVPITGRSKVVLELARGGERAVELAEREGRAGARADAQEQHREQQQRPVRRRRHARRARRIDHVELDRCCARSRPGRAGAAPRGPAAARRTACAALRNRG